MTATRRRMRAPNGMSDIDRFLSKVDRTGGPNACWPWIAGLHSRGYGHFAIRGTGRTAVASRWIMEHTLGRPLSPDEFALHKCDNKPCCNPAHLYVGTRSDNARDAAERGRLPHRLTPEDVASIRADRAAGVAAEDLARRHGVTGSAIRRAITGSTWGHVSTERGA